MLKVARTIERVANADVSVMLLGASGTGKELLARGVHDSSSRRKGQFVAINRSEEHTSELQSLMRISYAVFCLKKKTNHTIMILTCLTTQTIRSSTLHKKPMPNIYTHTIRFRKKLLRTTN